MLVFDGSLIHMGGSQGSEVSDGPICLFGYTRYAGNTGNDTPHEDPDPDRFHAIRTCKLCTRHCQDCENFDVQHITPSMLDCPPGMVVLGYYVRLGYAVLQVDVTQGEVG